VRPAIEGIFAGTLTANDELLTDFEEELARYDAGATRDAAPAKRARLAAADPTVNIAADAYDGFSRGYGVQHGPGREPADVGTAGARAADLADELNMHADVVLRGVAAGGAVSGGPPPVASVEERARSDLADLNAPRVRHLRLAACRALHSWDRALL
jgi:hypothetical protein